MEVSSCEGDGLRDWQRSLRPRRVDIVGDFAGKELFGIHGEALVAHCLGLARVDYEDGLQLLHAVYAVERFLNDLQQCGCNFHVLWFDDLRSLSVPRSANGRPARYLLTRAVLIKHLRQFATGTRESPHRCVSFVFPSISSGEFDQYARANALHFVMCSAGEPEESDRRSADGLAALCLFTRAGYSLGFISDVEFRSTKVYTNIVTPSPPPVSLPATVPDASPQSVPVLEWAGTFEQLGRCTRATGNEMSAREQIALVACASILSAEPSPEIQKHATAFLVHVAILERSCLTQRSHPKPAGENGHACSQFLEKYSYIATDILEDRHHAQNGCLTGMDVFDLVDGRLYRHILDCPDALNMTPEAHPYVTMMRNLVGQHILGDIVDSAVALSEKRDGEPRNIVVGRGPELPEPSYALLPFKHPVLDRYLDDVQLLTCTSEGPHQTSVVFRELTHWHNVKRPIDPRHTRQPPGYYARRRNQKFMADTIAYSASLTNATGKNIEPEPIVVRADTSKLRSKTDPHTKRARQPSKLVSKQPKPSGRQAGYQSALAIQMRRAENKSLAVTGLWDRRCAEFQREPSLVRRYLKAEKYLSSLSKSDMETIGAEVLLFQCNTLGILRESSLGPADPTGLDILALVWANLLKMRDLPINTETRRRAERLAGVLGMPLSQVTTPETVPRRLPFETTTTRKPKLTLPTSHVEFQLEHCGPYLERSFDSAPDARVPFEPDAWQRDVLDAIDADKSLFVVAPTSAGKTFISFYAMKKVLQQNDDDILVYVAPTKALVNQIAAEIQARYSKSYRHDGRSVWAIHTRDYRVNNPAGCQVLVTVPHILQIMLLAPSNAQTPDSWARRVRRIIFDEVHCIGQAEDGIIWEQLLLLAPCPIIALSATVGNPLEFREWLAGTQKVKGFDFVMVTHSARYSDLRKFLYTPPAVFQFDGLRPVESLPLPGLDVHQGGATGPSRFAFIHPIGSITSRDKGTLDDISLEPRDCLLLWRAMTACANEAFPMDLDLSPERYLPSKLKKSDVLEWENGLKRQLLSWMQDPQSPFSACQKILRNEDPEESVRGDTASTMPLLVDLRSHGALPAILFNYDREECENILFTVLHSLDTAEQRYRVTSPVWKKKMSDFAKWRAADSKSQARPSRSVRQPGMTKADSVREKAELEQSPWSSFHPDDPLAEFSFADMTKISRDEFEDLLAPLGSLVRPLFVDALRRGLGVHHAGMSRQYRQVVELLFRRAVITVVVATGTLALGVNMPCKTVVFTGDSIFLTALNYRQASGRAGRRGFDLLGNVVFHRIPKHRALEIMSSRLPDLRGTFPLSVTLVLRLLGLLHATQDSDYAIKGIDSLFTQTRLYLGGPASRMSITHHLRFSLEYLRRQNLISAEGEPLNLAGLVGHLYFAENAVFAFHSLLKEGYFHELCADVEDSGRANDVLLILLTVLCHLFCRVPCPRYADTEWMSRTVRSSPSMVILPPLPQRAKAILEGHNKETLDIFAAYVRTYVQQHLKDAADDRLPFTGRRITPRESVDAARVGVPILPAPVIRSPFAALSGFTDDFGSIHELVTTSRAGVFLDESAMPYIPIYPEETNNVPFNAYILDFFKHGDLHALVRDNGIKRSDVWYRLKDFSLILATIVTSMQGFLNQDAELDDATMADIQDVGDFVEEGTGDEEDEDIEYSDATMNTPSRDRSAFMNVHKALRLLQLQFDEKFRKVWA